MYSDIYSGQDEDEPYKDDKPKYERDYKKNKYVIVNDWKKGKLNNNKKHVGFFPRMWSSENAVNYLDFTGFLDFSIKNEFTRFKKKENSWTFGIGHKTWNRKCSKHEETRYHV